MQPEVARQAPSARQLKRCGWSIAAAMFLLIPIHVTYQAIYFYGVVPEPQRKTSRVWKSRFELEERSAAKSKTARPHVVLPDRKPDR